MRYVDEYHEGQLAQRLLQRLRSRVEGRAALRFMEVCGTHTVSIFRSGLRSILPPEITPLPGPGCPVCVTAQKDIDKAIEVAGKPDTILVTFGDMLKVPGTRSSLQAERAKGADVRIVYSPADALTISREHLSKRVVFFGVGFETTSPTIALVVREARRRQIGNFFLLSVHKVMPPALKALLESGDTAIDGFILPGHVSAIIGDRPYSFLATRYHMPSVISGFQPLDILQSICMLVDQVVEGRAEVEIQYRRVVRSEGNPLAQEAIGEVFEPVDVAWRGLGEIPLSGLRLRDEYVSLDAERAFEIDVSYSREPAGCSCGSILRGVKQPYECGLFARACTPENPVGPCMVSFEGTCSAFYQYGEWRVTRSGRARAGSSFRYDDDE